MAQSILLPVIAFSVLLTDQPTTIQYNGQEVEVGLIQLLGMLGLWWAFAAVFGFGFWRGVPWTRHAFLVVCAFIFTIGAVYFYSVAETAYYAASLIVFGWYFYGKRNVRQYFGDT